MVRIFGMIFTFPIETFAVTLIDLGVRWVRLKLTEQTTTRPTAEFVWAVLPFVKGVLNGRSRRTIPGTCGAIFARSLRRRFLSPEGVPRVDQETARRSSGEIKLDRFRADYSRGNSFDHQQSPAMVTLRCTHKLLRYLRAVAVQRDTDFPTTRLGDWYANLLFTKRRRLIVCVSESSLLPVIVAAKDPSSFSSRFREAVRSMLWTVGVSRDALDRELLEMAGVTIGRTANRSVLCSLNELALGARYAFCSSRKWTS